MAIFLAVPTAIAYFVPRRWRITAIVAWLMLPIIVAAGFIVREFVVSPPSDQGSSTYVEAFGFFLAFGLLPWLAFSGVGFAIGFALRRRRRRPSHPHVTEATPQQSIPSSPRTMKLPVVQQVDRADWAARHIGFERDGLVLDGVDIWNGTWRPVVAPRVELPHPAHPAQRHAFRLFDVTGGSHIVRFAAAELSNGVWGFYTRNPDEWVSAGVTANGVLHYETRYVDSEGPQARARATTASLSIAATRAVLADGAGWMTSRIKVEAGGTLLLILRHFDCDVLFRVDPVAWRFETVGAGGAPENLDRLAEAIERAHGQIIARRHEPLGLRLAPDGSIKVEIVSTEWSPSHWVDAPRVIENASRRILLDLWNTDWDAEVSFPRPRAVALQLRRYAAPKSAFFAELDLTTNEFLLLDDGFEPPARGHLEDLRSALERASSRTTHAGRDERRKLRSGPKQWFVAVCILAAALVAIAAITAVVLTLSPSPTRKVLPLPAMPTFSTGRQVP